MFAIRTKLMLLVGLAALTLTPTAWASPRNQKTVFTFNAPVEIPGQILPAGTYVFKLADSQSNRHIVQVFNKEESRVYGTFLAIPNYRLRPAHETIVTFHERPAGSPIAVRAWFYPGANYGHEFVYPKPDALALARANNTPVPAMPAELAANTTKPAVTMRESTVIAITSAPLKAEEPDASEVEVAQAFPDAPSELPSRLPTTATSLPLIGLAGLLALSTAMALRFGAARVK
jgi:hypothetical protein